MTQDIGEYAFCAFLGFCIGVGVGIFIGVAHAGEPIDVRAAMERTEAILIEQGYQAHGYARTAAPEVLFVEDLPNRDWGHYQPGAVVLSLAQPADCIEMSLVHELSHDATVKMLLIDPGSPMGADEVKARYERIAELVENHMADEGKWLPGCLLRRGVS